MSKGFAARTARAAPSSMTLIDLSGASTDDDEQPTPSNKRQRQSSPRQGHAPLPRPPGSFVVLTWNLEGTGSGMGRVSTSAPPGWSFQDKRAAVVAALLESHADIVCLQEVDQPLLPWPHTLMQQYDIVASASSCPQYGYTQTLLRKQSELQVATTRTRGPCCMVELATWLPNGEPQRFTVANGHLAYSGQPQAATDRLAQATAVAAAAAPPPAPFMLCGDLNMRDQEGAAINAACGTVDAWELAGSPQEHRFTWNCRKNHYFNGTNRFATCRFDRLLLRGLRCPPGGFRLYGDQPASPNEKHFLSDHFGIIATLLFDEE